MQGIGHLFFDVVWHMAIGCCADQPWAAAEVLQYTGTTKFSEPRWWNVGYAKLQGEDLNYLGVSGLRIAGSQGVLIIAVCQVCSHCLEQ